MSKKAVLIIIAGVLLLGTIVFFAFATTKDGKVVSRSTQKTDDSAADTTTDREGAADKKQSSKKQTTKQEKSKDNDETEEEKQVALYEAYTHDKFDAAKDKQRVLFFTGKECPQCDMLDKDIKKNITSLDPSVHIFSIDYDKRRSVAQKYSVIQKTTVLKIDSNGKIEELFMAHVQPTLNALKIHLKL